MLRFEVRALAKDGVVALNLDAADARAAAQLAAERGYAVLSVARRAAPRRGRDRFALVLFTQELLALLRAGLGLVEAIQALAERQTGAGASGYLDAVLRALRDGHPLSTALKVAPAAFPPIYVETVRAAERTGALVEALERYVAFQIQV
jgi:general secretion pathway protein F